LAGNCHPGVEVVQLLNLFTGNLLTEIVKTSS